MMCGKYRVVTLFCTTYKILANTGWRMKCRTIDCAHNTFLLLQKNLTSGTELILIGWEIVPNEEHVQCDHRFAALHFLAFSGLLWKPEKARKCSAAQGPHSEVVPQAF
jgi:hypothetical protein